MSLNRNIYTGLAVLLLFTLFPAIGNDVYNTMTVNDPVIKTKVNSVQALPYHDPIFIYDNSEFTAAGFTGSGIPGDPYILKDYFINGSTNYGIFIQDTDATFTIQNVHVNGSDVYDVSGIMLWNVDNGHIIDCKVTNSTRGVALISSDNNTLTRINSTGNVQLDFFLAYSDNNTLSYNNATGADFGFFLGGSSNNTLIGNNATDNIDGFDLYDHCNDNLLVDNYVAGCIYGFNVTLDSNFNNFTVNTAVGIASNCFYFEDSHNNTLVNNNATGNFKGFGLVNSDNSTLSYNNATGNYAGFELDNCSNTILNGNNASGNDVGFYLSTSDYNTLAGNIANNNRGIRSGFYLYICNNNTLIENTANGNNNHGFNMYNCDDNKLIGNTANGNTYGFYITSGSNFNTLIDNDASNNEAPPNGGGEGGFYISNSHNNTLTGNNASENVNGFYLLNSDNDTLTGNVALGNNYGCYLVTSNNNTLARNIFSSNTYWGINIAGSGDNVVYYNYFMSNRPAGGPQASDNSLNNYWTNGTHGNYWSDYTGVDSGNGIGNINYTLDGGQQVNDTKPLVSTLQVTGPGNQNYEASITSESISWLPVTLQQTAGYELFIETVLADSGSWMPGVAIQVDIDLMAHTLGTAYNYTLVVSDIIKSVIDTVWVTVEDNTDPVIGYTGPDSDTFEIGDTGHSLTFSATDLFPGNFTLYQNGSNIYSDSWISGESFTVSIDDLSLQVCTHYFTLVVWDSSGNEATKTIIIIVTDQPVDPTSTTTSTSSSSSTTTTSSPFPTISPSWTAPLVLLSLAIASIIVSRRERRRKK